MLVDSSAPKIATYTNPQGKKPFKMPISNKFNVEDFFISFESVSKLPQQKPYRIIME